MALRQSRSAQSRNLPTTRRRPERRLGFERLEDRQLLAADVRFIGQGAAAFISPAPAAAVVTGVNTSNFSWGDPANFGTGASRMTFASAPFNARLSEPFSLGTLSYFNGSVRAGSDATQVTLRFNMSLSSPISTPAQPFTYVLGMRNSPNTTDPVASADSIVLTLPALPSQEMTGPNGQRLKLEVLGFSAVAGGGFGSGGELFALESKTVTAQVMAKLVAADVRIVDAQSNSASSVKFTYQAASAPGSFSVGLYRSADKAFDPSDTLVATKTVTPAPNSQGQGTFVLPSPLVSDASRPWLLVVADPQGALSEPNEDDNNAVARLPDLAALSLEYVVRSDATNTRNGPLPINRAFTVDFTIVNQGAADAQPSVAALYVSQDANIDPATDRLLTAVAIPALVVGQKHTVYSLVVNSLPELPRQWFGEVHLGVVVDALSGALLELNEQNNRNQGLNVDVRSAPLFDPAPDHSLWLTANGASPLTFSSRRAAELHLRQNLFQPPQQSPWNDASWSRALPDFTWSWFNGKTMLPHTFRVAANILEQSPGVFVIEVRGASRTFNPARLSTLFGEPNPRAATWHAELRGYVADYQRRFGSWS